MFKNKNKMLKNLKNDKMPSSDEVKQLIIDITKEKELYEELNASLKEKIKEVDENLKKSRLILSKLKPLSE